MSEKYNSIMEMIVVTEEMRQRILNNVRNADLKRTNGTVCLTALKRYIPVAACFAVLFMIVIIRPRLADNHAEKFMTMQSYQVLEYASASELSSAVGFNISDVHSLPFKPITVTYTAYGESIGQIIYENNDQNAVYRKSKGNEDNSGDYNNYDTVKDITVNAKTVTLKGNGGKYTLALWSDGEYSYSLSLTGGLEESGWSSIINNIK